MEADLVSGAPEGSGSVFEYWSGNPAIEIIHGHIRTLSGAVSSKVPDSAPDVFPSLGLAASASSSNLHSPPDGPDVSTVNSSIVLATSVPCYMSAPEFCEFVGCFGDTTHRQFKHCRVLHGHSREEYLIALWLDSPEAAAALIAQHDGRQFNAIEPGECWLHRVVGCLRSNIAGEGGPAAPSLMRTRSRTAPDSSPAHTRICSPRLRMSSPEVPLKSCPPSGKGSPTPTRARASDDDGPPAFQMPEAFGEVAHCAVQDLFESAAVHGASHSMSPAEKTLCAVCLELMDPNPHHYQLSELGGGVPLTILCGHTFHARCLSRWCDESCPVCRFQQHPNQTSSCDVCGQSEGLHICLVCGFIGCIVDEGHGHAHQHFEATSHCYAIEVSTQRVWDYSGNGYVHRLLYNDQDGKMVEHSMPVPSAESESAAGSASGARPGTTADTGVVAVSGMADVTGTGDLPLLARSDMQLEKRAGSKKQEAVVSEFNSLLASQMTAQRRYYEERRRELENKHFQRMREAEAERQKLVEAAHGAQHRLQEAISANEKVKQEISEALAAQEMARRQATQLEVLNQKISGEQRQFEDRQEDAREQQRLIRRQRAQEVEELQQQMRDLELYLKMRKKCEASTDEADIQGSHVVVTESERRRGRGGRRGKRS